MYFFNPFYVCISVFILRGMNTKNKLKQGFFRTRYAEYILSAGLERKHVGVQSLTPFRRVRHYH
jgi:hypothetical protein